MCQRTNATLLGTLYLVLLAVGLAHAGPLEHIARESGRPLIVRFGLDRCLQCIRQGQAFAILEPKHAGRMAFRSVHLGDEPALAGEYQVLLVPTVLFFDATGGEVFRNVGYLAPEELEAAFFEAGLTRVDDGGRRP